MDLSALADRARSAASASAASSPSGSAPAADSARFVVDVNDASFEQVLQLSHQVVVMVGLYADQVPGSDAAIDDLLPFVAARGGRFVLGRVRGEDAPGVFQAFQLQTVPAVVALIKGQPVPIYQGMPPADWDDIFTQLTSLADEHGVTGSVPAGESDDEPAAEEPASSPEEDAALEAIGRGDYAEAQRIWQGVLAERPADAVARQGLLNAQLLERIADVPEGIRERAAGDADDIEAHLLVADLDLTNGHVEDAFTRLLRFVASHAGDEREAARARLVEHFELVGPEHPAVGPARRRLAAALF
ncbi:tetratricopeptide repeat protein [Falsarthrobacter nasiphocae]